MNATEPRLEGFGLRRAFRGLLAIDDVSIRVEAGRVHALVGLNGAGKTTLMRLLLGMLRPDAGGVRLDGTDLTTLPRTRWSTVGQLIQPWAGYPELDVRGNLVLAARLRLLGASDIERAVDHGVAELGLEDYLRVPASRLSQGNQQRLGLAAALQHLPDVVLLDEPTNALDPAGVILLREALLRRRDAGAGILVSSHHLDEVARIADRISLMNRGRLIGTLDPHTSDLERAFFEAVLADDEARR